jgi:hypothetical protein
MALFYQQKTYGFLRGKFVFNPLEKTLKNIKGLSSGNQSWLLKIAHLV